MGISKNTAISIILVIALAAVVLPICGVHTSVVLVCIGSMLIWADITIITAIERMLRMPPNKYHSIMKMASLIITAMSFSISAFLATQHM